MYILSQILVVVSDVFCIISMLSKNKRNIVLHLIISTILFSSHYMCLSAWTGAAMGIVEMVFLITMYLLEIKDKTKYNLYITILTMVISLILSILTWAGWITLLPMISMLIYLITMIFANVIIVKTGTFIRLALNGVYMFLLRSYFGAGLSLVILAFTILGIVNEYRLTKKIAQTQSEGE